MKAIIKKYKINLIMSLLILGLATGSCEEYLDKAPAADITENDVFKNFVGFQGFIEEMYACLTNYHQHLGGNWYLTFNCADEMLSTVPLLFDDGNYWYQSQFLYSTTVNTNGNAGVMSKWVWPLSWYAIRKANLALEKIDLMTDATQEEKDFIKGQALFFRGFFYFDLMRWWGGLPYIDRVLSPTEEMKFPRLNYRETALKAAQDFKDAAALLPLKWDDTTVGKLTLGNNVSRITKIHALAYYGKDLLYAASPMMNESSTGNNSYDAELCKQAATAFSEVIKICDETGVYKLHPWATWSENFTIWSPGNRTRPGGTEVIMNQTVYEVSYVRYTTTRAASPVPFGAGNNRTEVPTHNYVKNYGMAGGLPIEDPASGYNPADPWSNRDPRFYNDIVYDGALMVQSNATAAQPHKNAKLYTGGLHKAGTNGSVTGYFYKKFTPLGCNQWDNRWGAHQAYHPWLRLADVYLMYAEAALHGYGSPTSSAPGSLTALQAVNIIRNRAQLPDLTPAYSSTKEQLMESIIRERAVELAFEGHRFFDLRRWNISGQQKYTEKTAIDFDRGPDGKPINMTERIVTTRVYEKKHNWLPFQVSFTKLYQDFPQNPGW